MLSSYLGQIFIIVLIIFLLFLVFFFGLKITKQATNLQYKLTHSMSDSLKFDTQFNFPIQRPMIVKPFGDYITEIYVKDMIEQCRKNNLMTTDTITLSFNADPRLIRILEPRTIPIEIYTPSKIDLNDPLKFNFLIRGDVDLPKNIKIECYINTKFQTGMQNNIFIPVFNKKDYLIICGTIIFWILVIMAAAYGSYKRDKVLGILFIVIVIGITVFLFPKMRQIIEIVVQLLKLL